jgi:hypothetical protein
MLTKMWEKLKDIKMQREWKKDEIQIRYPV